jgi:hypothetical protein
LGIRKAAISIGLAFPSVKNTDTNTSETALGLPGMSLEV